MKRKIHYCIWKSGEWEHLVAAGWRTVLVSVNDVAWMEPPEE